MRDCITLLGRSKIQHGKFNDRIYLMSLHDKDAPDIIKEMDDLALKNGYAKIFAKIPATLGDNFEENGYREEARVPGFYNCNTDGLFMSKYFNKRRSELSGAEKEKMLF